VDRPHRRDVAEAEGRALDDLGVGRIEVDADGHVRWMNDEAVSITGWSFAQAVGLRVEELLTASPDGPLVAEALLNVARMVQLELRDGRSETALVSRLSREQGEVVLLRRVRPAGQGGGPRRDALTGLVGRDALLAAARHVEGATSVLAVLDVDAFELAVAACGYDAGDMLLQWVGARLRELVCEGDLLAHLTGSCFGLVLRRDSRAAIERALAEVQHELASFRFNWDDCSFRVETRVGAAVLDGRSAVDALRSAMDACRSARERGGPRVVVATGTREPGARQVALAWVANLEANLGAGRAVLYAQPVKSLRGLEGASFEVLLRVVGADGAHESPVSIIAAAERHGGIERLDRWVIEETLRALGRAGPDAYRHVRTCSINLSGASVTSESLFEFIVSAFGRFGVPPQRVCFEITETAAIADLDAARYLVQQLAALGARVAIDDFGAGVASFGYLRDLPVDAVKIDGSLVRRCRESGLDRCIIESVVRIAGQLGAHTVAEWVDDHETTELLMQLGVDSVQGYFHGRPAPLADLLKELRSRDAPRQKHSGVRRKDTVTSSERDVASSLRGARATGRE
jgi:EAL domain-containing protein (putative c-di-GMP-specific phosphodiesterase class I)/GGDEF domain-containing protein